MCGLVAKLNCETVAGAVSVQLGCVAALCQSQAGCPLEFTTIDTYFTQDKSIKYIVAKVNNSKTAVLAIRGTTVTRDAIADLHFWTGDFIAQFALLSKGTELSCSFLLPAHPEHYPAAYFCTRLQ